MLVSVGRKRSTGYGIVPQRLHRKSEIFMRSAYSATVVLRLIIAGQVLALAQVGPDFITLRESVEIAPSTSGRLEVIVDERVATSKEIFMPHGTADGLKRVLYL